MTTKPKIRSIAQVALGLLVLFTGVNKFAKFMSMPEMPEAATAFMRALADTGYMMPLIALTEIVVGVLLVAHLWSALALLLLAPVSVNIILFHLALAPGSILLGLVVAFLNLYLLFVYKDAYAPLLRPKR